MIKNIIIILTMLFLFISNSYAGLTFDNADDIATCGTNDALLLQGTAMTISAWIYPNSIGETAGRIISKGLSAAVFGVSFSMLATGTIRFIVDGATDLVRTSSDSSVSLGAWHHVLVTWDGSVTATNVHIYVDGTETSYKTTTNGLTFVDNAGTANYIGNTSDALRTFDGVIDEVAVWSVVLTTQEIKHLALSRVKEMPLQIRPASLQAYWPLDEAGDGANADGVIFRDISGHTNDCTADNGANNTGLTGLAEAVLSYP